MIAYHATNEKFDEFDTLSSIGSHFGTQEQAAYFMARRLITVDLALKNPLRVPDLGTWTFQGILRQINSILNRTEIDECYDFWNKSDVHGWNALKAFLIKHGYDSFVYTNMVEGEGDSYIAFYPHQIKIIN